MIRDMDPHWTCHVTSWAREQRVSGLAPASIELWTRYLRDLSRTHPDDPWTITRSEIIIWLDSHTWVSATRRSARTAVVVFFRWAEDTGLILISPAARLPKIKYQRPLPRPAPDDVIATAIHQASPRVRLMIMLGAFCGLRRREIAAVHTDHLDGQHLRVVGKGERAREVPVPRPLAAVIRNAPPGWLFPSSYGAHLSPPYVGKLMSRALPGQWTAHTLRHAAATAWADAGLDLHELRELLGHASTATTEIYTLVRPERLTSGVEAAALRLTQAGPGTAA